MSLAPRPALLAGREELLADLDALLIAGSGAGPQVVTLHGLGGAGKTSVAVEYAHRHLAEVGVAWQFAAEDATVLAAEFGELAAQLGVRSLADVRDPVASVHAVLARFSVPWLLLFDNAEDMTGVAAFLPPAGPGRVLITSQNPHWPGQAVDVPVLGPDVAAGFLISRSGDSDRAAAQDLAGALGGLPLALEQAAAYIKATGMTLAVYLSVFRGRAADLLARGQAAWHPASVIATLSLALSRLGGEAPSAAGLLQLLACLAPEPVPLALLLSDARVIDELDPGVAATTEPLLGDPVAAGDAIAALRRYSLVTPAGDGLVLVHRLVQAVTLARVSADVAAQWKQAAAALVEAAVPVDPAVLAAWPVCAMLLPHARATLHLTSVGIWRIAQYLVSSGSYPAARDLVQLIVDAHSDDNAYGPEHPDTLAARNILAQATLEAGDAAAARDQCTALVPVMERVLGPEHPDTLAARNNLAQATLEAGDAAAARDQCTALVLVMERVRGPEHPDTLAARNNLAQATLEAGDAAAARDQYTALAPVMERVLGPEHPDTLAARNNLAQATGEAGDAAAARHLLAELVPVMERVLGPEHPATLMARNNLVSATLKAGDAAAARDQYTALAPVMERVLGPEHPDTLMARNNLAQATLEAGDAAAARDQCTALAPVMERVLGPEHPDTLAARNNLVSATLKAGDAAAARDQYTALVPVMERVLGPEHPNVLAARNNLAQATLEVGDAAAARDQCTALVPVMERVLGPEHPNVLAARNNLAQATLEVGDAAAARDQCTALAPVMERVLGPEHPDTLMARNNLAQAMGEAGDAAAARHLLAELVPVMERVLGPRHPKTLDVRFNLAVWIGFAGNAARASHLLGALLPICVREFGPRHPKTMIIRSNITYWNNMAMGWTIKVGRARRR